MPKVKFSKDAQASKDGVNILDFEKGQVEDVTDDFYNSTLKPMKCCKVLSKSDVERIESAETEAREPEEKAIQEKKEEADNKDQ